MTVTSSVSTIALRTFPIFQGLGDDRLAAVARCAMMRRVPRGAAVVHEGDRTDFVYFVLTGNLKVMVSDEDGREVILTILGQGEMFGEMGVLDDSPRSASVVAVSPSDLVTIAKTDFKRLMQDNFELAWHVMCNLTRRLRDADRKIESLALMDVYGRVARPACPLRHVLQSRNLHVHSLQSNRRLAIGCIHEIGIVRSPAPKVQYVSFPIHALLPSHLLNLA